ncbi:MAG: hypothetical protein ACXVEE_20320 [Polyangiales bacterium]
MRWHIVACLLFSCASPKMPATTTHDYEYDVEASTTELRVVARFPPGGERALELDRGAARFVADLEIDTGAGFSRAESTTLPACSACRFRYRFALAEAAKVTENEDVALDIGGAILGAPSAWLLHPKVVREDARVRYRVRGAPFLAGHAREGESWVVDAKMFARGPNALVGDFASQTFGNVSLATPRGAFDEKSIARWVTASSDSVGAYFGRFPVDRVLVVLLPREGSRVGFGRTTGNGGASIVIDVGRYVSASELADDWVLPHELVHLGFPRVERKHRWIEEGTATYVEPLARARRGRYEAARVWWDLVDGLPNGLPKPGDRGLDRTHTWGRVYWGGALYCLLADIEIRKRTHNTKSFDDAMRAIRAAGGDVTQTWPIEKALAIGDAATGTNVMRALYDEMALQPMTVDLDDLWKKLGVRLDGDTVRFDDTAALADIRRAIAH